MHSSSRTTASNPVKAPVIWQRLLHPSERTKVTTDPSPDRQDCVILAGFACRGNEASPHPWPAPTALQSQCRRNRPKSSSFLLSVTGRVRLRWCAEQASSVVGNRGIRRGFGTNHLTQQVGNRWNLPCACPALPHVKHNRLGPAASCRQLPHPP